MMDASLGDTNRAVTHAPLYKARHGYVASLIVILSNSSAFLFAVGSDEGAVALATGVSWVFAVLVAVFGMRARNRRVLWIRALMVMSIVTSVLPVFQIGCTLIYLIICLNSIDPSCPDERKVCFSFVLISAFVTFVASIKASCVSCDGVCSCCNVPLPPGFPQSDISTPYQVFENTQATPEPQIDIAPDIDGLYKGWQIQSAEPRMEQFDPKENYVLHESAFKGFVLIINNDQFRDGPPRPGSELDVINIEHVFSRIGYQPLVVKNRSAYEIIAFLDQTIRRINAEGSARHASVVLVLMSHGEPRGVFGTDMKIVTVRDIKSMFSGRNCPALLGKPKIFFIQACRGQMRTKSALDTDNPQGPRSCETQNEPDIDSCSLERPWFGNDTIEVDGDVPDNADIYVAYATPEGYYSIRDRVSGSWFIQALCEELIARVHIEDLDTIMNRVTRRITGLTGFVRDVEGTRRKMLQTPEISKQGIGKKIYFMPNYPPMSSNVACSSAEPHGTK